MTFPIAPRAPLQCLFPHAPRAPVQRPLGFPCFLFPLSLCRPTSGAHFFRIRTGATVRRCRRFIVVIKYYKCLNFGNDRAPKVLDCLQIQKTMVLNTPLSLIFSKRHDDNVDCFHFLKAPV